MFSSMASAPASSIKCAYCSHPPFETPLRLALTGMLTLSLACRISSRYPSGPRLYVCKSGKKLADSGKLSAPRARSKSRLALSSSSCSSNREGNTTAAMLWSSSRLILSTDSQRGEAEASKGDFRFKPRYFVERSLIPLPLPSLPVRARIPAPQEQYEAIQSGQPLPHGWNTPAIGVRHRPAPPSEDRARLQDCCGPAWCSAPPGKHTA